VRALIAALAPGTPVIHFGTDTAGLWPSTIRRRELSGQSRRQPNGRIGCCWSIQFFENQPKLSFHRAQDFRREINESAQSDAEDRQSKQRIVMYESETADYGSIFCDTEGDI
jgi:hypothetical protein